MTHLRLSQWEEGALKLPEAHTLFALFQVSHGFGTQRMRVLEDGEEIVPGVQHTQVASHPYEAVD